MSGFEIAGVVLGAFPMLYGGAKDLRAVFKDVKTWWRFENEFEDFIAAVDKEYIAFSQVLEILIAPLDLSHADEERLLNSPREWKTAHLQDQLRKRIKDRYWSWFAEQLEDMNSAIDELHSLLPLNKAYYMDSQSLESEMFRLRTSFRHRKDRLLATIQNKNEALYSFLDRASHSTPVLAAPKGQVPVPVKSLMSLQRQVRSLTQQLSLSWECNCSSNHPCQVSIIKEGTEPDRLGLVFEHDSKYTKLYVEEVKTNTASHKLETRSSDQESISGAAGPAYKPTSKQEEISSLKKQISLKTRFKQLRTKKPAIFALAASIIGNPKHENTKAEVKLKKPMRFEKPGILPTKRPPAPAIKNDRQVKFAGDTAGQNTSTTVPQIQNMCRVANGQVEGPLVGGWELDTDNTMHLYRMPDGGTIEKTTLESILAETQRRDKRLQIGLMITSVILSFGATPLIPDDWDKNNVILWKTGTPQHQPHIRHDSFLKTISSPDKRANPGDKAQKSLFALGVLLLELLFGEKLDQQPFRKAFLGEGGLPNEYTDLCTAMSWQKKAENEFGYVLGDAIRRCIMCSFEPPLDLGKAVFVSAIWRNVAQPLEEFLTAWNRDPLGGRD